MHRTGHEGVALLVYTPIAYGLLIEGEFLLALGGLLLMLALAMLPDIDMRIPMLPHRGPTHSILFALVIGGVVGGLGWVIGYGVLSSLDWVVTAVPATVTGPLGPFRDAAAAQFNPTRLLLFGFGLGTISVLSHLLGDVLTPMGIAPFWPLPNDFSVALTRASDPISNMILFVVGWVAIGTASAVAMGWIG